MKITLDSIVSGFKSVTKLISNFDKIEDDLNNKVLYRNNPEGEPNYMQNDLDMNSYNIINQGNPVEVSGFNWTGDWSSLTTYAAGDAVHSNGTAYIAIAASTNQTPPNGTYWQIVAEANYPTQTGNADKALTTDGSAASWGSIHADHVDFTNSGTGGVERTLQAKLEDVVNVKDFGTVGDGVTDDTAAIQAACASGKPVLVNSDVYINSAFSPACTLIYGGGLITLGSSGSINFAGTTIDCPHKQLFSIPVSYTTQAVSNTTVDIESPNNFSGELLNKTVDPEWFGAVVADSGSPVDSWHSLNVSSILGNLNFNGVYYISKEFLLRNNRIYEGTKGRAAKNGVLIAPEVVSFTGTRGVYNYEQEGVGDLFAANGSNQNPYITVKNWGVFSEGVYRPDNVNNPFTQADLFFWETGYLNGFYVRVRKGSTITLPTMNQLLRIESGPAEVKNIDVIGVDDSVNIDVLGDYSVDFVNMTDMEVASVNYNVNANKGLRAVSLKEAPSTLSNINIERHPSAYGGNASTRPQLTLQGPVLAEGVKLSTEVPNSLGVRSIVRPSVPYEPTPILRNITTFTKPNDPDGYFSIPLQIWDGEGDVVIESYDTDWLFGTGFSQGVTSVSGIHHYDGGTPSFIGAEETIANHPKSTSSYVRTVGTVAIAGTVTIPLPALMKKAGFQVVGFDCRIVGRSGLGPINYKASGYLEGVGGTSTLTRLDELSGAASWSLSGDYTTDTITITNDSASSVSGCVVSLEFFGTPSYTS